MTRQKIIRAIKDPKQLKLFENPNYSRILHIMRNGELTVKEIHKRFNEVYEGKPSTSWIIMRSVGRESVDWKKGSVERV